MNLQETIDFMTRAHGLPGRWAPIETVDFEAWGSQVQLSFTNGEPPFVKSEQIFKMDGAQLPISEVALADLEGHRVKLQMVAVEVEGEWLEIIECGAGHRWLRAADQTPGTPCPHCWTAPALRVRDAQGLELNLVRRVAQFSWGPDLLCWRA